MSNATPLAFKTQSLTHQWVAFVIMVMIFAIAPIWVYPIFLMKVMCFAPVLSTCFWVLAACSLLGTPCSWARPVTWPLIQPKSGD